MHKMPTTPNPNILKIRLRLRASILNLSKYDEFFGTVGEEVAFSLWDIEGPAKVETKPSEGETCRLASLGEFGCVDLRFELLGVE